MKLRLGTKIESSGKWSRKAVIDREVKGVDDLIVHVVHRRGKRVRIPYKPRGENIGYEWWGEVYENGRCLWHGKINKSNGVRGILKAADLIT